LMAAIESGHADIVALLLREGASADPEIIDSMGVPGLGGTTPLYSAVMKGDLPIVRQLLECGVDVDRPSAQSWTSLKSAAHQGNEDIVRALLEAGADPNIADDSGYTPLMNAVSREHEDIVRLLLEFHASPDIQGGDIPEDEEWIAGRSALMDAVASGNLAITQALLEHDADTELRDGQDMTALGGSLHAASSEMVDLLLSAGADLDAVGPPGSAFAMLMGYGESKLDVAQVLLEHGFDPDTVTAGGMSMLQIAARVGSVGFTTLLIESGVDVLFRSRVNCTAFDLAANYEFDEVADLLRNSMNRAVPEIDRQDDQGATPLMKAVKAKDLSAVKSLLAQGADASRRDRRGDTPLSFAVVHGLDEIVAELRQSGAERLDESAASGTASLVGAAQVGALGTVLDLLDAGIDVDETNADGETALIAAAAAHPGLIRVLARKEADLSHRDDSGRTAYMAASSADRKLIVKALTEAGAPVEEVEPEELAQVRAQLAVDDDSHDPSELLTASFSGNAVAVSRLIAMGADVNQQDEEARTPLALALIGLVQGSTRRRRERDFLQIIDSLLAAGASPSSVPIPSIMLGAMTGRPHIVAALLKAGASLDSTMEVPGENDDHSERANALTLALSSGESGEKSGDRVSLVLIAAGIDLSFREESGSTAAHLAARNGRVVPLRELLKRNPDLKEATDRQGVTPLMECVEGNQLDCLKVLLDAGADRDARNAEGRTARDLALAVGHGVLADELLVQPA
jgi:ankyrin repeat protein